LDVLIEENLFAVVEAALLSLLLTLSSDAGIEPATKIHNKYVSLWSDKIDIPCAQDGT
jgi:hypothetical protein